MQRWFFLDDRKSKSKRQLLEKSLSEKMDEAPAQGIISTQPWEFAVSVSNVNPKESVFLTGNTTELGEWDYTKIVPLEKKKDSNIWVKTITIPNTQDVLYRYVIGSINEETNETRIVSWESHVKPRVLKDTQLHPLVEEYGKIDDVVEVSSGWLTNQSLLQFKFMNNPLQLKARFNDRLMNIKVTPVSLSFNSECNEETKSTSSVDAASSTPTSVEVSTLSTDLSVCALTPQEQFGREYKPNDILIINIYVPNLKSLAYLVDFYSYSNRASVNDPPCHIGYTYVLPNMIKPSEGSLHIPVTCNVKHRPLGTVDIEYLIIYPLQEKLCDLQVSYAKFWEKTWTGLDVGHRGLGASFKTKGETPIRENTIASLKKAAASGADMLEFDVQLSKDMIPVIYHDFYVCISMKRKRELDSTELLEMPVKDLTLEHLQKLKVYHLVEGRTHDNSFFDDEELEEHQPFPTLEAVFKAIDATVGFNIELKWTMELSDGSFELINPFDMNVYVDKVLEVVLKNAGDRRIVFSCFNPDICTMVRYKQNKFPVMFLTVGVTKKYQAYRDPRCLTIPGAAQHAVSADILGIAVHSEDLLRDPTQVKFVMDAGLVMFCWGDDNNDKNNIKKLKDLGLHAVIYDHLDQYTTKEVKESIFLVEARESQRELVRAALLEGELASSSSSEHSGRAFLDPSVREHLANYSTVTSLESLASGLHAADSVPALEDDREDDRAPKRTLRVEALKECQLQQSLHGHLPAGDTSTAKPSKKSRIKN